MKLQSGFNRILTMMSVNGLATALISVFISIYLLEIGYSLSWVIYYLMVHHGVLLFGAFAAIWVSNHIGLVKTLILRFLFLISYLVLLFLLPQHPELFFVIAALSGIESAFFGFLLTFFSLGRRKRIRWVVFIAS